jgi:hypothetical protein
MLKGLIQALLTIMDSDHISNAWPECLDGNDSDECTCSTCVSWAEFKGARDLISLVLEKL